MTSAIRGTGRNRLLQTLSSQSREALQPHLEFVELPVKTVLVEADEPTEHVVFVESGLASIVARSAAGKDEEQQIEVGHIGWEGLSGINVILGVDRTPTRTFMQMAGSGHRVAASALRDAAAADAVLQGLLMRYVHTYQIQLAQSALANGRFNMHQRLARWLLMCHDRVDGDDLPLTHDFLSLMLGVRRSGVTNEIHVLEGLQVIKASRAHIEIRNRVLLEAIADGCYGLAEREYERLIGASATSKDGGIRTGRPETSGPRPG